VAPDNEVMTDDGSPIRCDRVGSFPWSVLHDRHPKLVEQIAEGLPYPPAVLFALQELAAGLHDEHWYDQTFLAAEDRFYRAVLTAVGYGDDGPWRGVDPFGPVKQAELDSRVATEELAALAAIADDLPRLLLASLWGNRADLGFLVTRREAADARLLIDDRPTLIAGLEGRITILADNAGRELLADLALIDHLLRSGRASSLVLHVKPAPCFVSDALLPDVLAALDRMEGTALRRALRTGQWEIRTDPFWFSPEPYTGLPGRLREELASSRLVIVKGDLNYRRLVQDRHWPVTDSFAERTAYFPAPVAALRTCKSEVVVGLDEPLALDDRVSGRYGLIQAQPTLGS
jgi:uncharacterized protein with ATP-grasp and redox domains